MPRGVDIHGAVLRELRDDRGWSASQLAEHAQAVAKAKGDRQFALDRHQICRYEHNRLRPSLRSLECMLTVLEPSFADLLRLLQPTDPLAALLQLTREAKQQPDAEQQAEDGEADPAPRAKVEKKPPVNRREFAFKLPLAVVTYVALSDVKDPLRAEIDAVTGAYVTSSPQKLLPQARRALDKITRALREPLMDGVRRRLLVDAAEVASVAARMALFAGHPGEADAYFTQALKLADQSQVDRTRGCALASASVLHDPLVGDGDSASALAMLQAAVPLVGSDGLDAKWVAMEQAEHFGERERDYEAMSLLERASHIELTDDGEGLYSLRGRFAGYDEQRFAAWSGKVLARVGRTGEALDVVQRQLSAPTVDLLEPAVLLGRIALIHIKGGDPEPACQAAIRSLHASHAVGYTVGADCILKMRGKMPPEWAPLACVHELDERLRALT